MNTLTPLEGGKSVTPQQADREWKAAWADIAAACEHGLAAMHLMHPRRGDLLELTTNARQAAGLERSRFRVC